MNNDEFENGKQWIDITENSKMNMKVWPDGCFMSTEKIIL